MPKTDTEVIDEAKRLIQRGWCKGDYFLTDEGERVYASHGEEEDESQFAECCLLGALSFANRGRPIGSFEPIQDAVLDTIEECTQIVGIAQFNDDPKTTKEDVLAILDEAKEKLAA